jgi:hypothetical protein
MLAAAAFSYLTLIQTFQLYVEIVFLGGHKELLDSVKGLSPAIMSRETAEAIITGGSNHFENAWRFPR